MAKKSKEELCTINLEEINEISKEVNSNVEYSLEVDPTNKYNMSDKQKDFIKYYCEYKNIALAAELCEISKDLAKKYYLNYATQEEVKRINKAMYQRQFSSKMMNLNEIGAYLTNLITEENLFEKDKLSQKDKLKVVETLLKLEELMIEGVNKPEVIVYKDIEDEIKNLSVSTINKMIESKNSSNDNKDIINNSNNKLSVEEEAIIKSMKSTEILKIVDDLNKEGKK